MMKKAPFDDPYNLLASQIVVRYSTSEINRLLNSSQPVEQIIMNELRAIDMGGMFVDCIITDLCDKGERMKFVDAQKRFSAELASLVDHDRLCASVRAWCDRLQKDLG